MNTIKKVMAQKDRKANGGAGMHIGDMVVRHKIIILIVCLALLIPSIIGYLNIRVNYDLLTYLPEDMETMKGQNVLMDEFNKGGFTLIVIENMKPEDVNDIAQKIEKVEHVDTVLNLDEIDDGSVPEEMLPKDIENQVKNKDATMVAVFFDTSTSDEGSLNALADIRKIVKKDCYVSGMTALVADLKNIAETEEPKYIVIAVLLSILAMMLMLDSFAIPFIFIISIGIAILYNLGSNFFLGEIAYITKAIAAVLQLGVTMDYSIFLWHRYVENVQKEPDHNRAMALAIDDTLVSVTGSSITTVAGFLALCFMSYTMGMNLGVVMAKGCVIGVLASVTLLPSMILVFDKLLMKTRHKPLIPDMTKAAKLLTAHPMVLAVIFIVLWLPAVYGYKNANISYDIGAMFRGANSISVDKAPFLEADQKLEDDFGICSTHMIIADSDMSQKDGYDMCQEIKAVKGVKNVLGVDSFLDPSVPRSVLPDKITGTLISDDHQLILVNSEYKVSTDQCNEQIDEINDLIHKYDAKSSIIGEGPATKDLIRLTSRDFTIVNFISILMVFLIIFFVLRSWSLPVILVATIEFAIYVNLGISGYTGIELPFIVPVCISTIQLGSTVDYAILMSTRYVTERKSGKDKREAVDIAAATSMPSILVSALGFFTATFGVGMYSDIGVISTLCSLMARGALISMVSVILVLPSLLILFDKVITKTTKGLNNINKLNIDVDKDNKGVRNEAY